ncbi:MAG: ABC transporter permease [Candidatus Delongbacteria bacterium]|nr:ABC transporter permease [Candidatus Delongbacteria bacterium]MBN2835524.1 ABC transporter permease [Candidatus Delongbacteria bacterium]
MKQFFGFIIKEFYHVFRDWRTLIILIGMPVIQIVLFGFAITNEINDAKIAILDKSKDAVTEKIISKILSSGYFKLTGYLESSSEIEPAFKSGKVQEVVIFQENFDEDLTRTGTATVQILTDAAEPNTANMLTSYTSSIIQNFNSSINSNSKMPLEITTDIKMFYNEELKSVFMFVPGVMALILMLVSAMMTSISITKEKEFGTMEILLASPLKPFQIIFGKVTPYLLISFVNIVIILVMAVTIFGMPIRGNILLLLAESTLFAITALAIGILISTITDSIQVAMMISLVGLMLPTILLSGFVFPVENMPLPLQYISAIIPARWFIVIIKGIMLKGIGLEILWRETIILSGMMIILLTASIKKFKVRLQ